MKVALLKGGRSLEREVSLRSAETVKEALASLGHDCVDIEVPASGTVPGTLVTSKPDIVWVAMHGAEGEDGSVQGLLETLGLPYVSEGVLASALGMDKFAQSRLFADAGIPTVPTIAVSSPEELPSIPEGGYVVKMNSGGSSINMETAERDEVPEAVERVLRHDSIALVQPLIEPLRELETLVLHDNSSGGTKVLGPIEVLGNGEFWRYERKYSGSVKVLRWDEVEIPSETRGEIKRLALKAFKSIRGSLYMRVDFFLSEGKLMLNEVNTIPGSTPQSHFNILAEEIGGFAEAVSFLLDSALARHSKRPCLA